MGNILPVTEEANVAAIQAEQQRGRSPASVGIRALVTVLAGLAVWYAPVPAGVKPQAWRLLAVFCATMIGLIAQPLPMGAMVLLGVTACILTGTLTIVDALAGYMNATVWLIVAAFLFSRAFAKTGLGRRIAYVFIGAFGKRTLGLAYALGLADMVLAPGIPSGAARTGGVIFPVVKGLASAYGSEPGPTSGRIGAYLMLCAYMIHSTTCAMFMTAMVANPLIVELTRKTLGIEITWGGWALAASVPGILSFLAIPCIVLWTLKPEIRHTPDAPLIAKAELARMGKMGRQEWLVLGIFVLAFTLWTTGSWTGLDPTAVALLDLCLLLCTGVITWQDVLNEHAAWDALVWFGGLVGMAAMLGKFGLTSWFSSAVAGHMAGWPWLAALAGLALVYMYAHYFFASLAAHTTAFFVPFVTVAVAAGAPPYFAALTLAFFSSLCASLTHYGGGPSPVYWGSGYLTVRQWWTTGFFISLMYVVVWMGIGPFWWRALGLF